MDMKMNSFKKTCLIPLLTALTPLTLQATPAFATGGGGASSSGGGELRPRGDAAAWFIGPNQPIRTCFEISPTSGVNLQMATQSFLHAMEIWRDYIQEKRVNEFIWNITLGPTPPGVSTPPELEVRLSTQVEIIDHCDESIELKVYFGVNNNPLIESLKAGLAHPIEFAHRTEYSPERGRGKGVIWIASQAEMRAQEVDPNPQFTWSDPYLLSGALAHALGHVLGCEHAAGTLMNEDIAHDLLYASGWAGRNTPGLSDYLLNHIDRERELFYCQGLDCPTNYTGTLSRVPALQQETQNTFRLFVGRPATGPILARLHSSENRPGSDAVILTISDQRGTRDFPIRFLQLANTFDSGSNAFYIYRHIGDHAGSMTWILGGTMSANSGYVRLGMIQDAQGQRRMITIALNSGSPELSGPLTISYIDHGQQRTLLDTASEFERVIH